MLLNYVKRFQLPLFFVLCLIISWAVWIPEAAATLGNREAIAGGGPLDVLAVWAPGLSATLLSLLMAGKAGTRALFRPIRFWRVGIQWYLFVLFYPAAVWLIARGIDAVLGQTYEITFMPILDYFGQEQATMVPVAFIFAFPNTLGEELGWRGFALPKLQVKYNALVSSIILGLFWGFWHIPLWIAFGQTGLSLLIDVVGMVGAAILYTWVYNSTGGSLLLVWLFHFAMTVTQYFLAPIPILTDDILSWGIVVLVVIIAGATYLSRKQES
jgi:membrane protease YdiL (CAAX protease family)